MVEKSRVDEGYVRNILDYRGAKQVEGQVVESFSVEKGGYSEVHYPYFLAPINKSLV